MNIFDSDSTEITCGFSTLLRQAPMTAHDYMFHALKDIDELFGDGYAAKNPELVGVYMKVCAMDYDTATRNLQAQKDRESRHAEQED